MLATSDQPGGLWHAAEAGESSPDAGKGAGEVSETTAAVPGAPPPAAQGELEPETGGDQLGMPQPCGREEQPAAG